MKGKPRRQDKKLPEESALLLLNSGEYGILSTIDSNSEPYGIPVNFVLINRCIYIHSALDGDKIENIKNNKKVSFCVVGKTEIAPEKLSANYESVIVFGSAKVINGAERLSAIRELIVKYSPDFIPEGEKCISEHGERTAVIKISIDQISGKSSW